MAASLAWVFHTAGAPSVASDQYSFCVTLVEALTGNRPFAGASPQALHAAKLAGPSPRPPTGSRISQRTWKAIARGLAADPRQRWPAMPALLCALAPRVSPLRRSAFQIGIAILTALLGTGAILQLRVFIDWYTRAR